MTNKDVINAVCMLIEIKSFSKHQIDITRYQKWNSICISYLRTNYSISRKPKILLSYFDSNAVGDIAGLSHMLSHIWFIYIL